MKEDIRKIEEYIELVLNKGYCECNELNEIIGKHCDGSKNVAYAINNILSDYKKVLKENLRLRYQDIPYLEGEIKGYKTRIEELKKEKEELACRCSDLDKEAQGYLEALAGDNTLTKRNIKQLQEENKELRETVEEYEKTFDVFNERTYRKKYIEERRAEQPNLLFPDADEIYKRYYELKEENEELKYKYDRALEDLVKSKTKIKDKIEELENDIQELSDEQGYWGNNDLLIKLEILQELLEEE